MKARVGIRREDKNQWESRVPLTPDHVAELVREHGIDITVEPSEVRAFSDLAYASFGAKVQSDLRACPVILGVKEIPVDKLVAGKTYLFFAHVTKGQPQNMPMLKRLMELGCTLIDYEFIVDHKGRRIIYFSRHAGYAGAIDSLWALGQRFASEGRLTPLADIRRAHQYKGLDDALLSLGELGETIRADGLPPDLPPIVVGFTGEGNVAAGAQEVFARLPVRTIQPDDLEPLMREPGRSRHELYKLLLPPARTVERVGGGAFDWDEYVAHPDRYVASMDRWLAHITMLIHGIYWEPRYPRVVTREWVREHWARTAQPQLRVIGDISCDIEGSIEVNVGATSPGDPVYVYEAATGNRLKGVQGHGPVIMAVDNLPCELPVESSDHFGDALLRFVPPLARCDWSREFDKLELPPELLKAVIVYRGTLTPHYSSLSKHLSAP